MEKQNRELNKMLLYENDELRNEEVYIDLTSVKFHGELRQSFA